MNIVPKSWLEVKKSSIPGAGKGLFASKYIPKGTKIVEYKGKVSTWDEAKHENGKNRYLFYVNKNHVIDAKKEKTALARFANDARGGKKIKGIFNNSTYVEDNKKIYIQAFRNIQPGAEILVGYGKDYWDVIKKL